MALTFQEIKDSYENSDLHIHVTKLPVPVILGRTDLYMLNADDLWPDPDQKFAVFDLAFVAELDEENATSSNDIIGKGVFISKPGDDEFVGLNDMTDNDNTENIFYMLANSITVNFFIKDGNITLSKSRFYILDQLKNYLCYDLGLSNLEETCWVTGLIRLSN